MKVYVSGPISGVPDYKEKFLSAIKVLEAAGVEPVYFADTGKPSGLTEAEYLLADLELLRNCDAMTALEGWENSRGCAVEFMFADYAKIPRIPFRVFEQAANNWHEETT